MLLTGITTLSLSVFQSGVVALDWLACLVFLGFPIRRSFRFFYIPNTPSGSVHMR